MKFLKILVLAMCLLVPATVAMADDGGWVISLKGGYGWGDVSGGLDDSADAFTNSTKKGFDDEDGWMMAAAFGYDWSGQGVDLRTELEYSYYSQIDYSATNSTAADAVTMSADINVQTLMLNVYYDFENSTAFTPYVGLGGGMAFISADVDYQAGYDGGANVADGDADATNFAWSASAGLAYELTEMIDLDLGVRYVDFGDTDTLRDGNFKWEAKDLSSTDVTLGIRFTF